MVSLFTLAGAKVRVLSLSKYWPQLLAMARLYQSCERRIKAKLTKWAERKEKANQQQAAKIQALNKKAADKATKKAAGLGCVFFQGLRNDGVKVSIIPDLIEPIYCEDCNQWLNGPEQYRDHLGGKRHRKKTQPKPQLEM
jgi:hypothetical protein